VTAPASASPTAGGALRWRLRPTFELFPAADGDLYLLQAGGRPVVVRRPTTQDRQLLEMLDGDGLLVEPQGEVSERLRALRDVGVVVPDREVVLAGEDAARFDRQLGYLAEFGDPGDVQRRLRSATVAVLGCGGVGTWALGALAGLGVGRVVLIDDDVVDLSNLNRQVLYRRADVGSRKVQRAAAWLHAFDRSIDVEMVPQRVTGPDMLEQTLPTCDLLIMAADSPPHDLPRWVNLVAVAREMPFATAGLQAPLVRIGPTYWPGRGPCYLCHETQMRREFPLYAELTEHQNRHPPRPITTGPGAGIVGSLIANEALNLLAAGRPATLDKAVIVDLRDLEVRSEGVLRDPSCAACRHLPSET
jgi:bacteriocin biosynthesis cyclodehydratase domain-containing protein